MKNISDYILENNHKFDENDPYMNHALNYLLGQPGWDKKSAKKYIAGLSKNEIERLARKDL